MSHELICSWLGLPADNWPPDHYRLLGLEAGEGNVALIEQHVHQRIESVRPYQMMHAEQATEAMNRLAQAWVCLTDPAQKKAYDQKLLGSRSRSAPPPPPPAAPARPEPRDPLVWLYTSGVPGPGELPPPPPSAVRGVPPLPVEQAAPPALPERQVAPPPPPPAVPVVVTTPPPEPPEPVEPVDPVVEAARNSPQAQRGLSTRRALFRRVARTRQLLRLWHRLSKHLNHPEKRLNKQEAADLARIVEQVDDELGDYPLLGEAGQPGHLIVSLTQVDRTRDLQTLTPGLRESLQRDWNAGLRFLETHRDYLRAEVQRHRQRSRVARLLHAVRSSLNEQPLIAVVVLLALAALGVAVWRSTF